MTFTGAAPSKGAGHLRLGLFDSGGSKVEANIFPTSKEDDGFESTIGYLGFVELDGVTVVKARTGGKTNPNNTGSTEDLFSTTGDSAVVVDTPYAFSLKITRDSFTQNTISWSGFGTSGAGFRDGSIRGILERRHRSDGIRGIGHLP
jgi:hypothetical protein